MDLPSEGVAEHGGGKQPEFLSGDVGRQVLGAGFEVGVPGFGVVALAVEGSTPPSVVSGL